MEAALQADDCDMIGIGRPAIINPSLPANLILNPEVADADARLFDKKVEPHWIFEKLGMKSVVGAGAEIVSHSVILFGRVRDANWFSFFPLGLVLR